MQLFKHSLEIPFIMFFKKSLIVSSLIILFSIVIIAIKGISPSIDFAGGTTINLTFQDSIDISKCSLDDIFKNINSEEIE